MQIKKEIVGHLPRHSVTWLIILQDFTLSPRVATGHSEPTYNKTVDYTITGKSGIFQKTIIVQGTCTNCMSWQGGSLDVNSKVQPFFYALGPEDIQLSSNSREADLRRHERYGQFNVDMIAAFGDPGLFPGDLSKIRNSSIVGHDQDDYDYGSTAHAVLMVGTFVILLPFGAAILRLQNRIVVHWITQSIGILLAIVGMGIGINVSHEYNRVSQSSH